MDNTLSDITFNEVSGRGGNLGLITLTRQQALNAFSQKMINAMSQQLLAWESASHIKAVVVRAAEGRAFCAGGDIRSIYDRHAMHDPTLQTFFRDEYTLTRRVHHYSKPYIALMDGITMGGGAGISIHASHRVASDRLLFAMPETGIGFYPDVGMTHVFARLPHRVGYYLGLTGARLSLADCAFLGLIDQGVSSAQFPELIYALADTDFENIEQGVANDAITDVIKKFSMPVQQGTVQAQCTIIENCFSEKTVEGIITALKRQKNAWCNEVISNLQTKSPTSLKVTLRALQEAADLDFDEAIQAEFRLSTHFLQGTDFFEGIRAAVVDKDHTPHFKPDKLSEVTPAIVKKYFAPIETELRF